MAEVLENRTGLIEWKLKFPNQLSIAFAAAIIPAWELRLALNISRDFGAVFSNLL